MSKPGQLPTLGPDLLARYEPRSVLGEGASGIVVEACQRSLDRLVALKLLAPSCTWGSTVRSRFEREARTLASLGHPGVVALLDFGFDGDAPYLVEERLEGDTLLERLDREACLEPTEAAALGGALAGTLSHLHREGILHRDLKPANIFLGVDGQVKLIDFGLALGREQGTALTATGELVGTPSYLAPELLSGAEASPATDLYALGVTLFLAVTGRLPFDAPSLRTLFARARDPKPPVASVTSTPLPAGLAGVIDALLATDPAQRPDAARVAAALARPDQPFRPRSRQMTAPGASPSRRRRLVGLWLVALGLGAVALARAPWRAPRSLSPAALPQPARSPAPRVAPALSLTRVGCTSVDALVVASGSSPPLLQVIDERDGRTVLERRLAAPGPRWEVRLEPLAAGAPLRLLAGSKPAASARFVTRPVTPVLEASASLPTGSGSGRVAVVPAGPPVVEGERLYAVLGDGSVACLALPGREVLWRQTETFLAFTLNLFEGVLYGVGHDRTVAAWSAGDGRISWHRRDLQASATVHWARPDGFLVRGETSGYYLLDRATGATRWAIADHAAGSLPWGPAGDAFVYYPMLAFPAAVDVRTGAPRPRPRLFSGRVLAVAPEVMDGELICALGGGRLVAGRLDEPPRATLTLPREVQGWTLRGGRLFAFLCDLPELGAQLCRIQPRPLSVAWQRPVESKRAPVLLPHRDRLYVVEQSGKFTCLAADDGTELWRASILMDPGRGLAPLRDGVLAWSKELETYALHDE